MIYHGELYRDWPWVKEGLKEIIKRNNSKWLPEDIYMQIKLGEASLYVNEELNSFAVIKPVKDTYTGEHGAFLIAVYLKDKREKYEEALYAMLENAGATFVEHTSKRDFTKIGWEVEKTVYRRRL